MEALWGKVDNQSKNFADINKKAAVRENKSVPNNKGRKQKNVNFVPESMLAFTEAMPSRYLPDIRSGMRIAD